MIMPFLLSVSCSLKRYVIQTSCHSQNQERTINSLELAMHAGYPSTIYAMLRSPEVKYNSIYLKRNYLKTSGVFGGCGTPETYPM
jgi:hypothetical protein